MYLRISAVSTIGKQKSEMALAWNAFKRAMIYNININIFSIELKWNGKKTKIR